MDTTKQKFSYSELRMIGISLGILSLGIALAWLGFFWMTTQDTVSKNPTNTATDSGSLK